MKLMRVNIVQFHHQKKLIDHNELIYMTDAVLDGWLTHGRYNLAFEKIGEFLDVKKVLTVNSGSSANLIAFNTLTKVLFKEEQLKKVMKLLL